jgi:hypothetical protein
MIDLTKAVNHPIAGFRLKDLEHALTFLAET